MSAGYYRTGANLAPPPERHNAYLTIALQLAALIPAALPATTKPVAQADLIQVQSPPSPREMGYTGNICSECNGVRMQIAGHCEVCSDCGATTGCS